MDLDCSESKGATGSSTLHLALALLLCTSVQALIPPPRFLRPMRVLQRQEGQGRRTGRLQGVSLEADLLIRAGAACPCAAAFLYRSSRFGKGADRQVLPALSDARVSYSEVCAWCAIRGDMARFRLLTFCCL